MPCQRLLGVELSDICTMLAMPCSRRCHSTPGHLHDELQLVLAALEHALKGLGGHEQQHAGEPVVQDDSKVVDVHAADDEHCIPGAAAIQRLRCMSCELRMASNPQCGLLRTAAHHMHDQLTARAVSHAAFMSQMLQPAVGSRQWLGLMDCCCAFTCNTNTQPGYVVSSEFECDHRLLLHRGNTLPTVVRISSIATAPDATAQPRMPVTSLSITCSASFGAHHGRCRNAHAHYMVAR